MTLADTPEKKRRGYIGASSISSTEGILFDELSQGDGFHMQNVKCPLAIAFIDQHYKIISARLMRPDETGIYCPPGTRYALECHPCHLRDLNGSIRVDGSVEKHISGKVLRDCVMDAKGVCHKLLPDEGHADAMTMLLQRAGEKLDPARLLGAPGVGEDEALDYLEDLAEKYKWVRVVCNGGTIYADSPHGIPLTRVQLSVLKDSAIEGRVSLFVNDKEVWDPEKREGSSKQGLTQKQLDWITLIWGNSEGAYKTELPLSSIKVVHQTQTGHDFREGSYQYWRTQIKNGKTVQPIFVEEGTGLLLDGHHRFWAAQDERLDMLPVIVVPATEPGSKREADRQPEKGCVMLEFDEEQAKPFQEFANSIPEEDLYYAEEGAGDSYGPSYGRETDSHITVLYGLETRNPDDVIELLQGSGPVTVEFGEVSLFENEKYDVLKVSVVSPDLHKLNKLLRDQLEWENDYGDSYLPHVTIAYLKTGEGKKYVEEGSTARDRRFSGKRVVSSSFTYSVDGTKTAFSSDGVELSSHVGGFEPPHPTVLQHKIDPRFSPWLQECRDMSENAVSAFLQGESPLVSVTEGEYTVHVMPSHRMIITKAGEPRPAPVGKWMGWWDPDIQEVHGLSEEQYSKLSLNEQAKLDAVVQAKKYAPSEYASHFYNFWHPKEYEKWWWDEGGAQLAAYKRTTFEEQAKTRMTNTSPLR